MLERSDGEPADAVQLHNEFMDRWALPEIVAMINRSESDIRAGRVIDATNGLWEIAKRYGFQVGF